MQGFVPSIVAPSPLWFDAQGTVSVVLRLVLSKLPDMLKDAAGFCLCYPPPSPPPPPLYLPGMGVERLLSEYLRSYHSLFLPGEGEHGRKMWSLLDLLNLVSERQTTMVTVLDID